MIWVALKPNSRDHFESQNNSVCVDQIGGSGRQSAEDKTESSAHHLSHISGPESQNTGSCAEGISILTELRKAKEQTPDTF